MVQIPLHLQEDEISVKGNAKVDLGLCSGETVHTNTQNRTDAENSDLAQLDFNVQYYLIWNATCALPVNDT